MDEENTLNLKNTATPQPQGKTAPGGDDEETVLNNAEKELRTRFELLPKEIQDTIVSSDYQMKLFELAKKYKLTYAELGQLELTTTMVLLGVTRPEDFRKEVEADLEKDATTLNGLVGDIDTQIFSSIRNALVALYEQKEEAREGGVTAPAKPLAQELSSFSQKPPIQTPGSPIPEQSKMTAPSPSTPVMPKMEEAEPNINLEHHEGEVLKNSGIELGEDTTPATPPKDPLAAKMGSGVFGIKSTSTDHSVPKMGDKGRMPNEPKHQDPYREIPE